MAARRVGPSEISASFAERFRTLAQARCGEICEAIVDKAIDGERWAAELVMKYAADKGGGVETRDALIELLEDIRGQLEPGS